MGRPLDNEDDNDGALKASQNSERLNNRVAPPLHNNPPIAL